MFVSKRKEKLIIHNIFVHKSRKRGCKKTPERKKRSKVRIMGKYNCCDFVLLW